MIRNAQEPRTQWEAAVLVPVEVRERPGERLRDDVLGIGARPRRATNRATTPTLSRYELPKNAASSPRRAAWRSTTSGRDSTMAAATG